MKGLPEGVSRYAKSPEFSHQSIPQYFGQYSSRPVSDGAIVTKVLVIGAGFFQVMALG